MAYHDDSVASSSVASSLRLQNQKTFDAALSAESRPFAVREPYVSASPAGAIVTVCVALVGVSVAPETVHFDFAAAVTVGAGSVPVKSPPRAPFQAAYIVS